MNITHDTNEYTVIINGVECDYCGKKEDPEFVITSPDFDQAICEDCWEHFNS